MQQLLFFTLLYTLYMCRINAVHSSLTSIYRRNLTMEICHVVQQEAISMGLSFRQSKVLPIKIDSSWSTSLYDSHSKGAVQIQSNYRSTFPTWPNPIMSASDRSEKLPLEFQSLCYPQSSHYEPTETCCTAELEAQLLQRTTDELHESLSAYLARWSAEIANLRSSLREEVFQTLEQFRIELNHTLCDRSIDGRSGPVNNCSEISTDLFPKFRLMVEQFIVGQGDLTLDISIPIDNLLMQLLIDFSCQSNSQQFGSNTLEAFNEEIRCHKYCQARLNLILDSLMSNNDLPLMLTGRQRRRRRNARQDILPRDKRAGTSNPNSSPNNEFHRQFNGDQYRLLYSPELLFTIRLNRILMQALELGESLIDGLKDFNAAQGLCMQKLMRMHYCALCAGETLTRPCPELCLTITSSCLQPLSELHTPWKRFTDAIKIVANTFLEKPQLSMMIQFRQLPKRLIVYFRHLLQTHKEWLQPQCSGTTKLLEILGNETPKSSRSHETENISKDANFLQLYRKLLKHLVLKMDQMADLWTRVSSSLCSESPHLASSTKQPDQCWNGTAKGRFHFEQCEFCDSAKASNGPESARSSASGVLLPPGRHQRTSYIPNNPEMPSAEMDDFSASSFPSATYLFNNPAWNTPIQHEKELAKRRANEILVRASRDLQWSTDSLLGELQAYNSIQSRMNEKQSDSGSNSHGKPVNGQTQSWVQIPENNAGAPNPSRRQSNHGDVSNSLGLLAYGSMLGWGANEFGRGSDSNQITDPAALTSPPGTTNKSNNRKKMQSDNIRVHPPSARSSAETNVDFPAPLDDAGAEGSGYQPVWSGYGWSQSGLPAQPGTPAPPTSSASLKTDGEPVSMEGSGVMENPGPLPSFMEYADYPHLNSFHSFLAPENSDSQQGSGPIEDDEDYMPSIASPPPRSPHLTIPDLGDSNAANQQNRTLNTSSFGADRKPDSKIKGAEGKRNGAIRVPKLFPCWWLLYGSTWIFFTKTTR